MYDVAYWFALTVTLNDETKSIAAKWNLTIWNEAETFKLLTEDDEVHTFAEKRNDCGFIIPEFSENNFVVKLRITEWIVTRN